MEREYTKKITEIKDNEIILHCYENCMGNKANPFSCQKEFETTIKVGREDIKYLIDNEELTIKIKSNYCECGTETIGIVIFIEEFSNEDIKKLKKFIKENNGINKTTNWKTE